MTWSWFSYTYVLEARFRDISYYINQDYEVTSGKCTSIDGAGRGVTASFNINVIIKLYLTIVLISNITKDRTIKYSPSCTIY